MTARALQKSHIFPFAPPWRAAVIGVQCNLGQSLIFSTGQKRALLCRCLNAELLLSKAAL